MKPALAFLSGLLLGAGIYAAVVAIAVHRHGATLFSNPSEMRSE